MKPQTNCRFHRFRDHVAFDLDDIDTLYISPDLARKIADKMLLIANDIETTKFTGSSLGTIIVSDEG